MPPRLALADCDPAVLALSPLADAAEAPLHRALAARGVAFDSVPWSDPRVDWAAFDGVLVRRTWDYHQRPAAFRAWVDAVAAVTRLWNPAPVLRWNLDKGYLRDLERAGVPIAPTRWFARGERPDLARELAERGWTRAFLKPRVGATSSDTLRVRDGAELAAAQVFLEAQLARQDMLLQPYLGRVEREGEDSLVLVDGRVTHAVRKTPAGGDYRVQDEFGARDAAIPVDPDLERLSRAALAAVPGDESPLLARVDVLRLDDGTPVLNELELLEPMLFLHHGPGCAEALVEGLLARLAD